MVLRFTIPSDFGHTQAVEARILEGIVSQRFGSRSIFAIKLALEEGLINAIKHGNKLDPHKIVHIEASITARRAQIIIEDQGPGFDRKLIPDPCAEENLEKMSGRGILLIETYMDRVEYSKGGRRLKMTKFNNDDCDGHTVARARPPAKAPAKKKKK